jgi:RNA polymerase sigma factor (sigma-70 family)
VRFGPAGKRLHAEYTHGDQPGARVERQLPLSHMATMTGQAEVLRDASTAAEISDWSVLMGRAQQGDRDAYRRLLVEITPYLRSLARRSGVSPGDVEDAVQDTLLSIHAIRHTYDPRRPLGPWLVTIARRRIVDHLRRQGQQAGVNAPFERICETFAAAEANMYEAEVGTGGLQHALERLPPGQKRAISLLKLREMSLKEAARESGMTTAALKVAAHRGLRTLRKLLGGKGEP